MYAETIQISINLGEVCDDIISACNLISKQLGVDADAEIKADVKSPDSNETRGIICRAVTEAIGQVKYAAQRYLRVGRREDTNTLERLGYEATVAGSEEKKVVYETQVFVMEIPNFNLAVTDALKSAIHKYIVDYTMWRFLQNLVSDKAGEYKVLASDEDLPDIVSKLNARNNYHKKAFV